MAYYLSKTVTGSFEDAKQSLENSLKTEGFGILTQIDIQATLKKKLDADFRRYTIMGACNPNFAYKALQAEENIGVLLPCNVVEQEKEPGHIQISVVNPLETMKAVNNSQLGELAREVSQRLSRALDAL